MSNIKRIYKTNRRQGREKHTARERQATEKRRLNAASIETRTYDTETADCKLSLLTSLSPLNYSCLYCHTFSGATEKSEYSSNQTEDER